MKKPAKIVVPVLMGSILWGCTSMIQRTGEILDGQVFKEKTSAVFRSDKKPRAEMREVRHRNGERAITISSSAYPGLTLRGNLPEDGVFSLTQAEILSTHVNGWNHFTLELLGEGFFFVNGDKGTLGMPNPPEGIVISGGKIRYKENRITGADASANLGNRRERILALTEWMKDQVNQGSGDNALFLTQKEFEKYWKRRIFPELVLKKNRPEEYREEDAQWIRGGGVKWNDNYTKTNFPEELWELRNSGALLRDWEESASWIFIEYSWDAMAAYFHGLEFRKTRN